jgi:succinyl-CoA synthetase beta subunit
MATMDIIKLYGGEPRTSWMWAAARRRTRWRRHCALSYHDPNVKAVMFNIFGGITRGDEVARGILAGAGRG